MSADPSAGSAMIVLYKGRSFERAATVPLSGMVVAALQSHLPALQAPTRLSVRLRFLARPDPRVIEGPPVLHNLRSQIGQIHVEIGAQGRPVVREVFSVRELLGEILLRTVAELDPEAEEWGYCLEHPRLDRYDLHRPTPPVEGSMEIDLRDTRPGLTVSTVEADPVPLAEPDEFGIDPARVGQVGILLGHELREQLATMPLSTRLEEGGFLLGRPHRLAPSDGAPGGERYLLEVSAITPAEHSGASVSHFTFTGDSFREVNRRLTESERDEQLVGWYHTHLFSGRTSGLSSIDVDMHHGTFRQPWQVAALINLTSEERLLRFYRWADQEMRECAVWVGDERGRYRFAGTALDYAA
ncbi:JAB N-terminal domain-containing protein [Kitasatospora sp. NPDC047058]|uniref:JAB N-terminal domain-containing protein n=1 Tax=Kitasatospora sp. NPDC047058 TaxID=3155620 RepID=UPI0033E3C31F